MTCPVCGNQIEGKAAEVETVSLAFAVLVHTECWPKFMEAIEEPTITHIRDIKFVSA